MAYIKKRGKKWQAQVSWYDLNNESLIMSE